MFIDGKRLFLFHMISFYYGNMVIFLRSCSFFKYIFLWVSLIIPKKKGEGYLNHSPLIYLPFTRCGPHYKQGCSYIKFVTFFMLGVFWLWQWGLELNHGIISKQNKIEQMWGSLCSSILVLTGLNKQECPSDCSN